MGIILFLVDTSASMNQRTFLGTSYLDVAKGAIETFMKYRQRDPASRGDRYMLVSLDEPPRAVKVGWKENHATFLIELKNLKAVSLSTLGRGIKEAFDLLNLHRLHTSIDHYGQGRNPFYLEPAVVIALTDGGKLVSPGNNETELSLPLDSREGVELTKEPFRWDQRLYCVLLRFSGLSSAGGGGGDGGGSSCSDALSGNYLVSEESVSNMCDATGGKCYVTATQKSLVQAMESLTQKLHPGVVLNFRKLGGVPVQNASTTPSLAVNGAETMDVDFNDESRSRGHESLEGGPISDSNPEKGDENKGDERGEQDKEPSPFIQDSASAWYDTRKMIFVKPNPKTNVPSGFWPIPESFWPDMNVASLPPRDAHPLLWFSTDDMAPLLVENFPFDKYELEPSPLTRHILQRRKPNLCWQVFINNSGKESGVSCPFGYLKASSGLTHVTLFVMAYNFRALLPLIEDLQRQRMRPLPQWRQEFADYIATVPSYYAQPLRNALRLMGAPTNLVPDSFDGQMSYSVTSYLRKLKKHAKMESERVLASISRERATEAAGRGNGIVDLGDGVTFAMGPSQTESVSSQSFRNPYGIGRSSLLVQLARMRTNFLHSTPTTPNLIEEVTRHQVPIGQMGNYQEHLKHINPLRELDSGSVRTQLFGNPFKLERVSDIKQRGDIDIAVFADEHMVEMNRRSTGHHSIRRRPRSPTPIPPRAPKPSAPSSSPSPATSPLPNAHQATEPSEPKGVDSARGGPENSREAMVPSPQAKNGRTLASRGGTALLPNSAPRDGRTLKEAKGAVAREMRPHPVEGITPKPAADRSLSIEPNPAPMSSAPIPFQSQPLLATTAEPRNSSKFPVDRLQLTRKRERTPSPTPASVGVPPSKRQALSTPTDSVSSALKLNSQNHTATSPTPVLGSRLGKPPEMSSASKVLGEEIQRQQGQENARLRALIIKEVRKPGKNFDVIFHHLEGVRGSIEVRKAFVQEVVREAGKFKRRPLIQQLEVWSAKLSGLKPGEGPKPGSGRAKITSQRR